MGGDLRGQLATFDLTKSGAFCAGETGGFMGGGWADEIGDVASLYPFYPYCISCLPGLGYFQLVVGRILIYLLNEAGRNTP